MVIGVVEVLLRIPDSESLKMKRMVIKSLKDRIHNQFNASVAEVSQLSNMRGCTLGIAHISNDKQFTNEVLSKIINFIEASRGIELEEYQLMFL
jgi:uncharacterized protein YlxP (DUF503 family)